MQRQLPAANKPRQPRWHDRQAQPVRPGSPVCSKTFRGASLYPPTPADPANVYYQDPKEVLVRRERNVSKPPRRGVHIPALPVDARGLKLRVNLQILRLVKEGKIEAPQPPARTQKAHVSNRQIRMEFIHGSILDADIIAKKRSDERLARRFEEATLTLRPSQWATVSGRRVWIHEIGHLFQKGEA